MSKHRHVTCHFCATCNGWCNHDVRIYNLYGSKAHSNVLSNNLCHIHLKILKIGCLTQQCWHHVQMKFWKFENCTFCEITSSNVLGFFFKPSEQICLIQMILMRVETLCSHQNYTSEIWSELKSGISHLIFE